MKIICAQGDQFFIKPDTALLRNNDPFFVPNFAVDGKVEARNGVAVKITRLVKCIDEKFAHRTWEQFAMCTDYTLLEVAQITVARSFDLSFAVPNEWHNRSAMEDELSRQFDNAIARASEFFTLKIGDYLFIPSDK